MNAKIPSKQDAKNAARLLLLNEEELNEDELGILHQIWLAEKSQEIVPEYYLQILKNLKNQQL